MHDVLVVGNRGFIGSQLYNRLLMMENDYNVEGLNRYQNGDLNSFDFESFFEYYIPAVIFFCVGSASVPFSIDNPEEDLEANVKVLHRMLFAMRRKKRESCRIIFLSSAGVYGQVETLPINESDLRVPLSPYAMHKCLAEDLCLFFNNQYGFDIHILRIFSAYGPLLRKQIFWDMYEKYRKNGEINLFGTGEETRDYIYIEDLIDAIILISRYQIKNNSVWNVASGVEHSIRDVALMFAEKMEISSRLISFNGTVRNGDPNRWRADITRISQIGFTPKTSIEEGIGRYVEWVRKIR